MDGAIHLGEHSLAELASGLMLPAARDAADMHLAECHECRELVQAWAWTSDANARHHDGLIDRGAVIGRFHVMETLGSGAMGMVYLAYDPDLDREVAIKCLVNTANSAVESQVLAEGRALAKLRHPNVVRVFEVGVHQDRPFLAMELVRGTTLEDWLDRPRSRTEILAAFCAAGRGLSAVHTEGLVHRDFKPSNVMIGEDGQVMVTDFGLAAKIRTAPNALGSDRAAGTPAYMAPEQFQGQAASAQSDQFSFCVALYRALAGHSPFAGDTPTAWLRNVSSGKIRPARGKIPSYLQKLLRRGLCAQPEGRYPSMDALLHDLQRDRSRLWKIALWSVPVMAAVGWAVLAQSQKTVALAAVGCEIHPAKFIGAWDENVESELKNRFSSWDKPYAADAWNSVSAQLTQYKTAWQNAYVSVCESTWKYHEQSAELLDQKMACLDGLVVEVAETTSLLRAPNSKLGLAVEAVSKLPSVDSCQEVTSSTEPSQNWLNQAKARFIMESETRLRVQTRVLGVSDEMLKTQQNLISQARALGLPFAEARAKISLSDWFEEKAQYDNALAVLENAALLGQTLGDRVMLIDAWWRMAQIFAIRKQNMTEANRWLGYAEAAMEGLATPGKTLRSRVTGESLQAQLFHTRALIDKAQGHYPQAIANYEKALAARQEAGAGRLSLALLFNNLAIAYSNNGQSEKSTEAAEQALAIKEAYLGANHPSVGNALVTAALGYKNRGQFQEAETRLLRAKAILEKTDNAAKNPFLGAAIINLGIVKDRLGQSTEALSLLNQGEEIYTQSLGKQTGQMALLYDHQGLVLTRLGRYRAAKEKHLAALAIGQKLYGEEHPDVVSFMSNVGTAHRLLGEYAAARKWVLQALSTRRKMAGDDRKLLFYELFEMVQIEATSGHFASAKKFAIEAYELADLIDDVEYASELGFSYAQILQHEGKKAQAVQMAEEALQRLANVQGDGRIKTKIAAWLARQTKITKPISRSGGAPLGGKN